MGVRIKDLLTRSSDLKTGGAWFAVDNGVSVDKVSGESMVEQFSNEFLERYKALIGTPLTASSASQMTDEEKIYVYTGSETGYTAGHWYYYDGSTWTDGGVYNAVAVSTDKTLTVQDKAADAKAVGDEITDLKADLDESVSDLKSAISDFANINTSPNLYNPNDPDVSDNTYINPAGTQETYNGRKVSGFIPVIPGEIVKFSREGASYTFASTCFYSSAKSVVSGGVYNSSSVSVPSGAKYVRVTFASGLVDVQIECNSTGSVSPYQPFGTTANLILDDTFTSEEFPPSAKATLIKIIEQLSGALDGMVDNISCVNLYNPDDPDILPGQYINPNGTVETVSGRTASGYMPVIPGEKVVLSRRNGSIREEYTWASICFYDALRAVVSGGQYNTNCLTVPDQAAFARVTFASTMVDLQIECNDEGAMTAYVPYFAPYRVIEDDIKIPVENLIGTGTIKSLPDSFRWRGALNSGDVIKLPVTNVKNQQVFSFSGDISAFSTLLVGRMLENGTLYGAFEIDAENVKYYCDNGSTETVAHGLTITNNIQVTIATTNTTNLSKAVLTSNGVNYDILSHLQNKRFIGDEGAPFAQSTGSALTNCSFSWTSRNIDKPIWMFGDSYMSLYSNRWVYHLIQDGYDKACLINAYAGEASAAALASLRALITLQSRPKYILWAMGMNDGDTDSAVNASWKSCFDAVMEICEENGILPILATIPNTPIINNTFKNTIIKNAGHRYVDFAAAVGATSAGSVWFSGMLNSDNVHPNVAGAIALYHQALADFPELTSA